MIHLEKFKFDRIRKRTDFTLNTYNMLDLLITNKNLICKNEIYIECDVLNKLTHVQKMFTEYCTYQFKGSVLLVTNLINHRCDRIEISGIRNKHKIFNLDKDEIEFILETYRHIKSKKDMKISLMFLNRLTLKIQTNKENYYIFLRSQIKL